MPVRTVTPAAIAPPKGPYGGQEAGDRTFRARERAFDELLDLLAEPFKLRLRVDLLLLGDHLFVGFGDRVDGLWFAAVSLEKLVTLTDQLVHTALAVGLGLFFERGNEALDAGSRLIRNADHLAVGRLGLLLEAIERGVGASDRFEYRSLLGFEDYAFCLVCHFTLP